MAQPGGLQRVQEVLARLSLPIATILALFALVLPAEAAEFPDGVATGALTDPALLSANCQRIKEDGGQTTVIGAVMTRIAKAPGSYDFTSIDNPVNVAISCGLEPAVRVFVQPSSSDDRGMPDDLAAYGSFFGALVAHLKGRVSRFGVENEVISPTHWTDTPAEYFELLKTAADAAHAANPDSIILDSVSSSGGFSIIEARKLWLAGDLEGALATIQESQTNDLGGGPYLTSTGQVPAYLSTAKVLKMQEFYDQLVAHRNLIDALQLHYYGPASSIPSMMAMVRADGFGMPIEIWELGRRYLDGRPFDQAGQADESTRLIVTSVGEGARYLVLQQYFDKLDNQMYGLIDADGNSRQARFAVRNTISMLRDTRSAERLQAGPGVDGYRFDRPGGWRKVLWSKGSSAKAGNLLGIRSTTVAVTGNQGESNHLRVSSATVVRSPRWFEPDMIEVTRRNPGKPGYVRVEARCPTASPTRFCQGWIRFKGGRGNRKTVAQRRYKIGRGITRTIDIRRARSARGIQAKALFAVPFSCPGGVASCRSWQKF